MCQTAAVTHRSASQEERDEVRLKEGWKHIVCCQPSGSVVVCSQSQRSNSSIKEYFPAEWTPSLSTPNLMLAWEKIMWEENAVGGQCPWKRRMTIKQACIYIVLSVTVPSCIIYLKFQINLECSIALLIMLPCIIVKTNISLYLLS